jgi:drug/metabolite transporter (DMT)-like permease
MTGAAFALYSTSILLTDVVRVLLLFYLTPVWGTLLGALLLGERITLNRKLALALGIAGLLVVLRVDSGVPLPRNLGDWMALVAGIVWAYGSLRMYREKLIPAFEHSFSFVAGGCLVSIALALLPAQGDGSVAEAWPTTWPAAALIGDSLLPVLLLAIGLVVPACVLIIGGGRLLSPGRVGILLMGEAVTGIATAALLTDEPFGLREGLGTALVLGAAVVEVIRRQPEPAHLTAPSR